MIVSPTLGMNRTKDKRLTVSDQNTMMDANAHPFGNAFPRGTMEYITTKISAMVVYARPVVAGATVGHLGQSAGRAGFSSAFATVDNCS